MLKLEARPRNRAGFLNWREADMSWNGSDRCRRTGGEVSSDGRKVVAKGASTSWGIGMLIVLCLIGGVILFINRQDDEQPVPPPEKEQTEQEKPAEPEKPVMPEPVVEPVAVDPNLPPPGVTKDDEGVWRYPNGLRWHAPNEASVEIQYGVSPSGRKMFRDPIFEHASENVIDSLVSKAPGDRALGLIPIDDEFVEDFKASLKEEIKILDGDNARVRRHKEMMIEVKKELAERMANGEDLKKIVKDTKKELRRLANYRDTLELQINDYIEEGNSDQDVSDFIDAANTMLEQNGMRKFNKDKMTTWHIRMNSGASEKGETK